MVKTEYSDAEAAEEISKAGTEAKFETRMEMAKKDILASRVNRKTAAKTIEKILRSPKIKYSHIEKVAALGFRHASKELKAVDSLIDSSFRLEVIDSTGTAKERGLTKTELIKELRATISKYNPLLSEMKKVQKELRKMQKKNEKDISFLELFDLLNKSLTVYEKKMETISL